MRRQGRGESGSVEAILEGPRYHFYASASSLKHNFSLSHWSRDKTSPGAGKRFFPDIFLKYISQASSAP